VFRNVFGGVFLLVFGGVFLLVFGAVFLFVFGVRAGFLRVFLSGGRLLVGVRAVRGGIAGTGVGDGDGAPANQQARCEHANSCSEPQTQQTYHHLLPTANGPIASGPPFATLSHSKTFGDTGIASRIRAAGSSNIPTTRSRTNHWRMIGTLKRSTYRSMTTRALLRRTSYRD